MICGLEGAIPWDLVGHQTRKEGVHTAEKIAPAAGCTRVRYYTASPPHERTEHRGDPGSGIFASRIVCAYSSAHTEFGSQDHPCVRSVHEGGLVEYS